MGELSVKVEREVFGKYDNKCVICGYSNPDQALAVQRSERKNRGLQIPKSERLEIHHLIPIGHQARRLTKKDPKYARRRLSRDELNHVKNLVLLCHRCHFLATFPLYRPRYITRDERRMKGLKLDRVSCWHYMDFKVFMPKGEIFKAYQKDINRQKMIRKRLEEIRQGRDQKMLVSSTLS